MEIVTKKAFKESNLEVNGEYLIVEGVNPIMFYEGKINGQHAFMHEFGRGPILSWRNEGELKFSEEGEVILGELSNFKIYRLGSKEYDDKIKIIRREKDIIIK